MEFIALAWFAPPDIDDDECGCVGLLHGMPFRVMLLLVTERQTAICYDLSRLLLPASFVLALSPVSGVTWMKPWN